MRNILLVEDDEDIQGFNGNLLRRRGYSVYPAMNLAEARERIAEAMPDIIVLDIMLPDGSGIDFLKELRQDKNIPVLLLTALDKSKDVVDGLTAGGDDYLAKPYDNDVLLARIESLLRRSEQLPQTLMKGALRLNVTADQAYVNGEDIMLTHKEFALLYVFVQNEDKNLSAEYLYEKVWGQPMNKNAGAVKHQIKNLRKKLNGSGYVVSSTRYEGYCFEKE